jgi:hypothetical protein
VVEWVVAGLFTLGGLRSLWIWSRRPFEASDPVDHALYALYVTGRVGLWFAFAGFFAISASIETQGRAFVDDFEPYRWYLAVPLVLASVQFVAGLFLGRREPR